MCVCVRERERERVRASPFTTDLFFEVASEVVLQILEVDDRNGGIGRRQELRVGAVHGEADPRQASANFRPEIQGNQL